jgi:putative PIN family toxin of toxin-antitoxin system
MRILCDTNVLVRSVISPYGPAAELLRLIAERHTLIVSPYVLSELYDVLRRPKIRSLHQLSEMHVRRVISRLYQLAVVVSLPEALPDAVPHDPKDNPIVMTAIAGRADVLCTLDHHFYDAAVKAVCASQGVRVVRDAKLLAELRAA